MEIKILEAFDEKVLREILALDTEAFPAGWQYEDAEGYYKRKLESKQNINIVAVDKGKVMGYMLVVPHNEMVEELKEDDPEMGLDPERLYVETMQIHPDYRHGLGGGKIFTRMLTAAVEEARKRTMTGFSLHSRTTNGLNEAVKKFFKEKITLVRPIPSWKWGGGEPYEYIEGDV